jgi:tetratricopeptide (TPR) repeat protein
VRSGQLVADRYRLEELIGSGGMGVVWRAVDVELGRVVAVKHASPGLGGRGAEWLLREARNAARVHHPNAVTLFDAVREDAHCWLVMEYVPAESLAMALDRNGPLDPRPATRIAMQIAAALAALHAGGIIHRDVKPGNVLVTEHGVAKLTDFGISRWSAETLTHSGPEPGTPAYQAPEIADGLPATSASDVYSLGATLFAIVEGQPPERGAAAGDRVAPLAAVLDELLARDPSRRPTAEAAQRLLGEFAGEAPIAVFPAPPEPMGRAPRQLPAAPTPFVGRQKELERLSALNDAAAATVATVSGAGGTGKTWLALTWAHRNLHRFPDGQLFADLRGFSPTALPAHPVDVLGGFLAALGVERNELPTDPDRRAELYRSLTADLRMLVVLDNAAGTDQVLPLLPSGAHCTVVVTSRDQLHGLVARQGARPVHVDMLTDTEAHSLLNAALGPDADTQSITELIELCGGFPLALGVIAARAATSPHLPLRDTVAELRALGVDALNSDDPTASLPTVLSWSLRRLTDRQREVFALLGIAPGPDTDLAAATCLTGLSERDTHATLRALADMSLVDRTPGGRYGMHDLVRAYAATVADTLPAEVREMAVRRVLDFYSHTAHTADRLLNPQRDLVPLAPPVPGARPRPLPDATAALAWFDAEHACLLAAQRTATTVGAHATVWHLAWGLHTFHYRQGHRHDRLAVWRAAADAAPNLPDPATHTLAYQYLGHAHAELNHHDEAITHLGQALTIAEHHQDRVYQAQAHNALAGAWGRQGDDRKALEHARRALEVGQGSPTWEAEARNAVGWYAARLGDYDTARDHCEAALTLHREHGDRAGEAGTLDSLGFIEHQSGNHVRAIERYRQALDLLHDLDYSYHVPTTLDALGQPHAALGQYDEARAAWRQALPLYEEQGRTDDATRLRQQLDDLGR